jgi:cell division protein FtsA
MTERQVSVRMRSYVGLDIGTTKVAAVIAEPDESGALKVVGVGHAPSGGIRRGVVVDLENTVGSIRTAVAEAERMSGVPVRTVTAGIAGEHVRSINSRGVIAVSRGGAEIGPDDVARVVEAARAVAIPGDREVLHVIPQEYVVDDQAGIKNPVGMSGVRLEAEVHIVTGAATSARNVEKAVQRAGLRATSLVLEPLASSSAVLAADEKELGCLLIDLGGGTTDVALFYEGAVRHTAIIGLGGNNVTHDLAVGLRTPTESAEELKIRHGSAVASRVSPEETVEVPGVGGRESKPIPRQVLASMIEPRMEEIFTMVYREVKKNLFSELLAGGVVLTGGGAGLAGVEDLAERIFEMPVRRGIPRGVVGIREAVEDPRYATAVGLVIYARDKDGEEGFDDPRLLTRIAAPVRRWLGEFF